MAKLDERDAIWLAENPPVVGVSWVMLDSELAFQIDLNRVDAGVRKRVRRILEDVEDELAGKIGGMRGQITDFEQRRLDRLWHQVRKVVDAGYGEASALTGEMVQGIAIRAAEHSRETLASLLPPSVDVGLPPAGYLEELAKNVRPEGGEIGEWFNEQGTNFNFAFKNSITLGLAQGDNNAALVERLFASGLFEGAARHAETLVRTSALYVANQARMAVYNENHDIIPRLKWMATLDGRTCLRCMPRDGKMWESSTRERVGHELKFSIPPEHFNCRCILSPVVATFRELGFDIEEPPAGTRASMDGQVPAAFAFKDWLATKSHDEQDTMLGPGRADLWRKGKITLEQLIDGHGRELTLDELRK